MLQRQHCCGGMPNIVIAFQNVDLLVIGCVDITAGIPKVGSQIQADVIRSLPPGQISTCD